MLSTEYFIALRTLGVGDLPAALRAPPCLRLLLAALSAARCAADLGYFWGSTAAFPFDAFSTVSTRT